MGGRAIGAGARARPVLSCRAVVPSICREPSSKPRSGGALLIGLLLMLLAASTWSCGGDQSELLDDFQLAEDGSFSEGDTETILARAGWPSEARDDALRLIECESERKPDAIGPEGEAGLFQIHPIHHERFEEEFGSDADPLGPRQNAVIALQIWEESGWAAWSTCF